MKNLIKLILLVILSSLFASCATQKRCLNKFPPSVDTVTIVEKRDSIVYKDTTIYVKLPVEIRIDSIEIPSPEVKNYVPDTVRVETSLAIAKAYWKYPNIKLSLVNKDDSLKIKLDNAIREAFHWKSEYQKITVTPQPIKYIPTIYKISLWLWIGVILTILGYIGFKTFIKK